MVLRGRNHNLEPFHQGRCSSWKRSLAWQADKGLKALTLETRDLPSGLGQGKLIQKVAAVVVDCLHGHRERFKHFVLVHLNIPILIHWRKVMLWCFFTN